MSKIWLRMRGSVENKELERCWDTTGLNKMLMRSRGGDAWSNDFDIVAANTYYGGTGADLGGDDLRFSNTTGILQKKKLRGLLVLK